MVEGWRQMVAGRNGGGQALARPQERRPSRRWGEQSVPARTAPGGPPPPEAQRREAEAGVPIRTERLRLPQTVVERTVGQGLCRHHCGPGPPPPTPPPVPGPTGTQKPALSRTGSAASVSNWTSSKGDSICGARWGVRARGAQLSPRQGACHPRPLTRRMQLVLPTAPRRPG